MSIYTAYNLDSIMQNTISIRTLEHEEYESNNMILYHIPVPYPCSPPVFYKETRGLAGQSLLQDGPFWDLRFPTSFFTRQTGNYRFSTWFVGPVPTENWLTTFSLIIFRLLLIASAFIFFSLSPRYHHIFLIGIPGTHWVVGALILFYFRRNHTDRKVQTLDS